ncbi:Lar family restriction alleviation protein [Providencia rettgeri]|nr:Lar family restriction alleviation protein [Providencia rettgeri]
MSNNLNPCPFCGSEKVSVTNDYDPDGFGKFYYVICRDCRAQSGAKFVSNGGDCPEFYSSVRGDWNRRSSK